MSLVMYMHPFSSYSQKAKTGFYEKELAFEPKLLDGSEPVASEFAALWPIKRFPVLRHGDNVIFEATSIIDYLDTLAPGSAPLVPRDAATANSVRMWDRFFDNYIQYPQQRMVYEAIGRESRQQGGGARWKEALETAYAILDDRMKDREWIAGDAFSLADCSAAPALLYADWSHPLGERFENVRSYRSRLLARPSYARALNEARPYRHLFPLGAPEGRD